MSIESKFTAVSILPTSAIDYIRSTGESGYWFNVEKERPTELHLVVDGADSPLTITLHSNGTWTSRLSVLRADQPRTQEF